MLTVVIVIAAVVVAAPLAAAGIVTFASLREDAEHSLADRPPGWPEAASRRILGNVSAIGPVARRRLRPPADDFDPAAYVPAPRRPADSERNRKKTLTGRAS
jgi:hypothetical protein